MEKDPALRMFLSRLKEEVNSVGPPTDFNDVYYIAKIKLSRSAMDDIQSFLNGEDDQRTGGLDDALSDMLVELKPYSLFTRITFGVAQILKIDWPRVAWLKLFTTIFAISFFVSIPWNWFYLYKEAYAKHQSKIMKMQNYNCMGHEMTWIGSLKEWYRTSFTLKDDPCDEYMKTILIDPLVQVPPIKAVLYTLTTFITEPLRALGEGISGFFLALLRDLPVILWIPVLLFVTLCILAALFRGRPTIFNHHVGRFLPRIGGDLPVNAQPSINYQNENSILEQNVIRQRQLHTTSSKSHSED